MKYFKIAIGDEYGIDEVIIITAQTLAGTKMLAEKRCAEGQRVWFVYEQDNGRSIFSK